jgi:hypothetical protein
MMPVYDALSEEEVVPLLLLMPLLLLLLKLLLLFPSKPWHNGIFLKEV